MTLDDEVGGDKEQVSHNPHRLQMRKKLLSHQTKSCHRQFSPNLLSPTLGTIHDSTFPILTPPKSHPNSQMQTLPNQMLVTFRALHGRTLCFGKRTVATCRTTTIESWAYLGMWSRALRPTPHSPLPKILTNHSPPNQYPMPPKPRLRQNNHCYQDKLTLRAQRRFSLNLKGTRKLKLISVGCKICVEHKIVPCIVFLSNTFEFNCRFHLYQGLPGRIGEVIKGKYPGAWLTWGDVPSELRNFWFNEFKVLFNIHLHKHIIC